MGVISFPPASLPGTVLVPSGVTPGSYLSANITVTAEGLITLAANGSGGGGGVSSVGLITPGLGLTVAGGTNPVTASGNLSVDLTTGSYAALALAVTALQPVTGLSGTYTYASVMVDANGQIVAISSGAAPASYTFATSLVNTAGTVTLVNDTASPGNSFYYGTNGAGTKGWYALPAGSVVSVSGTANQIAVTTVAGAVTVALSPNVIMAAPATGIALTVNGKANADAASIVGSATTGQSYGLSIQAGTNATDSPIFVESHAGTQLLVVSGDGGVQVGTPTGGTKGLGTLNLAAGLYFNNSQFSFEKPATFVQGGAVLTAAGSLAAMIHIPYACTLQEISISSLPGNVPVSATFNLWKLNAGTGYPPTVANDMTGGANLSIASVAFKLMTSFTGWTTACAKDDFIFVTLASNSVATALTVNLRFA